MPDPAEIKIKASGAPEAQSAVKSVADTIAELGKQSGLAAGDLKIFETVLRDDTTAGIELTASLGALSAAKGQVSEAVRSAAREAIAYVSAASQSTAATQALALVAAPAAASLGLLAAQTTALATALYQVGGAGGGAAGGINQAGSAAAGAGSAASTSAASFVSLYLALRLVRAVIRDFEDFRKGEEELDHLAEATGVSAERLAQFEGAIDRAGGKGESFGIVINKLARSIELAHQGDARMADDLKRLGVTAKDPIEAFYQIADTVHNTTDRFEALGVASQVLNRNSQDLVGIFAKGAEALRDNAVASDEVAKARAAAIPESEELTRAQALLYQQIQIITADLLPSFTTALKFLAVAFAGVTAIAKSFTHEITGDFETARVAVASLGKVADDALHGRFAEALTDVRTGLKAVSVANHDTTDKFKNDWAEASQFAGKIWDEKVTQATAGSNKPFAGPAGKDKGSKGQQSEIDGEIVHNAALAKLDTEKADTALAIQKGEDEGRIASMENVHSRAIAMALEELKLAQERAERVGLIDQEELQQNLGLLATKRAIAAQDKNGGDEVIRIDREIQALKDQYAEKQQALIATVEKARAKASQTEAAEARKTADELSKILDETNAAVQKTLDKAAADARKADAEKEAGAAAHEQRMLAMERDAIETRFKLHQITAGQREALLDQVDAHEIKLQRDALQRELTNDAVTLAEKQRVANQIQALDDKLAATEEKNNQKHILTLQAQWAKYFSTVNRGFESALDNMLTGQKSFGASMQQLFGAELKDAANAILQRVLLHIEGTATIQAAEKGMSAILQALHLEDAATNVVTDKATALSSVTTAAGVAAANAYAATAIIPVVGPELAPAAAATAYAGALGFGSLISAEGGAADIPGTTGAILHAREMVLPAELAERVRSMTGGAGSFTMGDVHVHGAGSSGAEIGKQVLATIKDHMRRNNMVPA